MLIVAVSISDLTYSIASVLCGHKRAGELSKDFPDLSEKITEMIMEMALKDGALVFAHGEPEKTFDYIKKVSGL